MKLIHILGSAKKPEVTISEENIAMVMSMGFSADMAAAALRNTDNNVERAVEWIFSHPEGEAQAAPQSSQGTGDEPTQGLKDGESRYLIRGYFAAIRVTM